MRSERRHIDCGGGPVSAIIDYPEAIRPTDAVAVVLAHGAGNDMMNPLLSGVHEGLAGQGFVTIKFNFPYKERGGRAPDRAPVLESCYRSVLSVIRSDPQLRPRALVIGGKSLGGRMASHLAAQGEPVDGLIFLGYPLHPAGQPDKLRVTHLPRIIAPMLFFAGTRDALCTLDLLRRALATLRQATLHVVEGGDHSFALPKALKRSPQSVVNELVAAAAEWIRTVVP